MRLRPDTTGSTDAEDERMKANALIASCLAFFAAALVVVAASPQQTVPSVQPAAGADLPIPPIRALVDKNCVQCHSARLKSGGVALDGPDLSDIAANPAPWERSVRKIRAGM